jgi:hypothetical protein
VRDRGLRLLHRHELLGGRDLVEMPEHADVFDVRP